MNSTKDMNLKSISDSTLLARTEALVREERELLTKVLHHLREIEARKLFSALGYKSLFDFAVRRLNYSEDQAYRRIAAMKLLREIPQVEEKINLGELSLTHLGLAQTLFRQEKKINKEMSPNQKLSVLEQMANKPVREAERIAFSLSSSPTTAIRPDRVNVISESHIEMKFAASIELQQKIEQLKGWLAHSHPDISMGELFEKLCDLGLQEWNPTGKSAAPRKRRVKSLGSKMPRQVPVVLRQVSAQVRREVFKRAACRCENCGSNYALEVDHRIPRALGGGSASENLRLLCRNCNQRAAIQVFGRKKIERYLNKD